MIHWTSSIDDIVDAAQDDLVRHCASCQAMGGEKASMKRVSRDIVVKIKMNLEIYEYQKQRLAWSLLRESRCRIPKPYRFFRATDEDGFETGYLFMQFLSGVSLAESMQQDNLEVVGRVVDALQALHTISAAALEQDHVLFTTGASYVEGFPWGHAPPRAASIEELETIVNDRLQVRPSGDSQAITFAGETVGLCHLELAPRNILLLDDGDVAFVDWATAAFLPLIFEVASLSYMCSFMECRDGFFLEELRQRTKKWIDVSSNSAARLELVHHNSLCFAL